MAKLELDRDEDKDAEARAGATEIMLGISEAHPHFSLSFSDVRLFPPAIKFIVWTEFYERFSYFGLKTTLFLFLSNDLGLSQIRSTEMFHLFTMACYATSVLGVIISDTLLVNDRALSIFIFTYLCKFPLGGSVSSGMAQSSSLLCCAF